MMKKTLSLLLALILSSMLVLTPVQAQNNEDLSEAQRIVALRQSEALEVGQTIRETLDDSEYGGMYIDASGNLHVVQLPNTYYSQNIFAETQMQKLEKSNKIITHTGNYSLKQLNDVITSIHAIQDRHGDFINAVVLDEAANSVKVELVEGENYSKTLLDFIARQRMIELTYTNEPSVVKSEVNVGAGYQYTFGNGYCSLAFMARHNQTGAIGFVTAGHCLSVNQAIYSPSGVQMGTTATSVYNTSTDAAFVRRTNTSFVPTATASYSGQSIAGASSSFIIQGASVNLEGATSKHTTGTITSTNASIGSIRNRITTSYRSTGGDSGGTMWVGRYVSGTYVRYIVGIHNGSYGNPRIGAYGTRIDYALNALGVSYYGQ